MLHRPEFLRRPVTPKIKVTEQEESLIPDVRGELSPSEMVERKLVELQRFSPRGEKTEEK